MKTRILHTAIGVAGSVATISLFGYGLTVDARRAHAEQATANQTVQSQRQQDAARQSQLDQAKQAAAAATSARQASDSRLNAVCAAAAKARLHVAECSQ